MENTIFSIVKDIFKKEHDKFVSFCRKRKIFVVIFLIPLILVIVDFKFRQPPITLLLLNTFIDCLKQIPQWLTTLVFGAWLIFLTFIVLSSRRRELTFRGDFFDDFRKGLRSTEWEWYGDWKIEEEAGKNVLSVTNSDAGGFTRIGTHWTNYIFSFDTRIINKYSSWLVRVKDRYNYLMFQCQGDCIVPHIRVNRVWEVCDPIDLNNPLLLNTWYTVSIKVRGNIVEIQINDNDVRYTIPSTTTPNLPMLYEKGNKRVIFDTDLVSGRVGFREYGSEKALFRKVKVKTIH